MFKNKHFITKICLYMIELLLKYERLFALLFPLSSHQFLIFDTVGGVMTYFSGNEPNHNICHLFFSVDASQGPRLRPNDASGLTDAAVGVVGRPTCN